MCREAARAPRNHQDIIFPEVVVTIGSLGYVFLREASGVKHQQRADRRLAIMLFSFISHSRASGVWPSLMAARMFELT